MYNLLFRNIERLQTPAVPIVNAVQQNIKGIQIACWWHEHPYTKTQSPIHIIPRLSRPLQQQQA